MAKLKNDDIQKRMDYFGKLKVPCFNCGRKTVIRYDKDSVICSWCRHLVFRTKKEYDEYYDRQNFKINLRKAMAKSESNESISNN